jgi:hypothetical protein
MKVLLMRLAAAVVLLAAAPAVFGDEGMWLFNNPPRQQLKKRSLAHVSSALFSMIRGPGSMSHSDLSRSCPPADFGRHLCHQGRAWRGRISLTAA